MPGCPQAGPAASSPRSYVRWHEAPVCPPLLLEVSLSGPPLLSALALSPGPTPIGLPPPPHVHPGHPILSQYRPHVDTDIVCISKANSKTSRSVITEISPRPFCVTLQTLSGEPPSSCTLRKGSFCHHFPEQFLSVETDLSWRRFSALRPFLASGHRSTDNLPSCPKAPAILS